MKLGDFGLVRKIKNIAPASPFQTNLRLNNPGKANGDDSLSPSMLDDFVLDESKVIAS